jgi:hypothetical protein
MYTYIYVYLYICIFTGDESKHLISVTAKSVPSYPKYDKESSPGPPVDRNKKVLYIYICTCIYMYIYIYICIYIYTCIYIYIYIYVYICIHTCIYTYMYTYMYIYIQTYPRVHRWRGIKRSHYHYHYHYHSISLLSVCLISFCTYAVLAGPYGNRF